MTEFLGELSFKLHGSLENDEPTLMYPLYEGFVCSGTTCQSVETLIKHQEPTHKSHRAKVLQCTLWFSKERFPFK